MLRSFILGWPLTIVSLLAITAVAVLAYIKVASELKWVEQLGSLLSASDGRTPPEPKLGHGHVYMQVIEEVCGVIEAPDTGQERVLAWTLRVRRLEPSLAFYVDFLKQLGLMGTVLGLGLSLAYDQKQVAQLLQPLSLAVWTTVLGLGYSITLTAMFGPTAAVTGDACEKSIEVWNERRLRKSNRAAEGAG